MIKYFIIGFCILAGCAQRSTEKKQGKTATNVRYASGFHFEDHDGTQTLVIDQPWPGASKPIRYSLKNRPKTLVCTSTSHIPYLELLESEDVLIGFPNVKYISSEVFLERYKQGRITDLGPDGSMNMELLMGLAPEAVIAFDMGGESQMLDKIAEAGIPVYYNSDFLEQSPLGRAEWIKFFGALLGKENLADSIFSAIEERYLALRNMTDTITSQPTILSGVVYGDTWFLPGGRNWAATFYGDAGGSYILKQDSTSGWKELSFESVYEKGSEADFWIGTSTLNSRAEMLSQDDRYANFRAFREGRVFNYNKRMGPNGGYDFFESGYARPDLVLSDLIKILHPELLPRYETFYFQVLK